MNKAKHMTESDEEFLRRMSDPNTWATPRRSSDDFARLLSLARRGAEAASTITALRAALEPFAAVNVHPDAQDKSIISVPVQWPDGRQLVLSIDGLRVRHFRGARKAYEDSK